MLLHRPALIVGMMVLPVRFAAMDDDIDRALPGAESDHDAAIRADRHEAGRRDQLDAKDKQGQRGQQAPRGFRMSDRPQHRRCP